jgi:hypothetical protein
MTRAILIGWLLGVAFILAFFQSATAAQDKITICHATGNGGYVTLVLPYNAVFGKSERSAHFNEQGTPNSGHENDYLGPCIPPATTTTEVPPSTSTTSTSTSTTTPQQATTTSVASTSTTSTTFATTTTAPQSTSTSTPKTNTTTTSVTTDTCEDLGTCPATTTSTIPADSTTTTISVPDSSTTVPVTLAYGGTEAARTFAPWAFLVTILGAAVSWVARRPV